LAGAGARRGEAGPCRGVRRITSIALVHARSLARGGPRPAARAPAPIPHAARAALVVRPRARALHPRGERRRAVVVTLVTASPVPSSPAAALVEAALAQLAEGIVLADAAGRITYVNEAAARLHGEAPLAVAPEEYAAAYRLLTDDGQPYPWDALPLSRAVLHGETVTDARWRVRRPDGSEVLAVGSARPGARPRRAPAGRRAHACATTRRAPPPSARSASATPSPRSCATPSRSRR
jgi:PAS domain-containing protein